MWDLLAIIKADIGDLDKNSLDSKATRVCKFGDILYSAASGNRWASELLIALQPCNGRKARSVGGNVGAVLPSTVYAPSGDPHMPRR